MADPNDKSDKGKNDQKDNKEPDFLTKQQDDAKAAIGRVVQQIGQSLKQGADVQEWARQYPWVTAGSAAAVGFLVGMLITPKKDKHPDLEQWKAHFAHLKEKVTPAPDPVALAQALAEEKKKQEKPGFLQTVLREAMKSVGPMLAGVLSGKMAQPDAEDLQHAGNGHSTPPPQGDVGGSGLPTGFGVYRDPAYPLS